MRIDRLVPWGIIVVLALAPGSAAALTLRYAIVVGNNTGRDSTGAEPFQRLRHAEREARYLRDRLVVLSNFAADPERTVLLTGASRAMVLEAARLVGKRKDADLAALGHADSLFAFFFTGHGLDGQLLVDDGPLTGKDVGEVFSTVGAGFNIGVFDACYSGNLDASALAQKGISLSAGNIFRELPDEVLTAEGSIWYVSSGPGEVSYEDQELGGVFTHFFTQALENANIDGPGITLEDIWHYTRNKTLQHTSAHGRRQLPRQYVARLRSTGPLYFSFPVHRDATLVVAEAVEGDFLLSYADGQLTERFHKVRGERQELAVYPGKARVVLLDPNGEVFLQDELQLRAGQRVALRTSADESPSVQIGGRAQVLWAKGLGGHELRAEVVEPHPTWSVALGYRFFLVPQGFLAARHYGMAEARVDVGHWVVGAHVGYGEMQQTVGSWSYSLDALALGASAGFAWNIGPVRLTAGAALSVDYLWQTFGDGETRSRVVFFPAAVADLYVPITHRFGMAVAARSAVAKLPGAGKEAESYWRALPGAQLSILLHL